MKRKFITPATKDISFRVPEQFVGKNVEIIAFVIDEQQDDYLLKEDIAPYLASESILAKDWLKDEEDQAWKDL